MAVNGRLSVLHWNIHSWKDDRNVPNEAAVEGLIRDLGPDAVSLTEVSTAWGQARPLSEIGRRLGYKWVFVPALEFRGDPATEGYGNALLTKLPILAVQQWRVHSPERFANNEPSEPRTVALAQLDVAGTAVWVGSTHLPASQEADRSRALTRLTTLLGQLETPWLICGDFNTAAKTWRDELPADVTVLINLSSDPVELPPHEEILAASHPVTADHLLPPDSGVWLRTPPPPPPGTRPDLL